MAKGDLFIIGGAEDKTHGKEILSQFVDISKSNGNGKIGILTTATEYPEEVGNEYLNLFTELGAEDPLILNVDSREQAESEEILDALSTLSSLFITGGNQVRLTSILGGTQFYTLFHQKWLDGMVLGGTSAGAAVMSRHMIMKSRTLEDDFIVEMGSGFGMVEDVIIDQHFSQRSRLSRLMTVIAHNPQIMGIGIDENTAIWVKDEGKSFEVYGDHTVTVIDGHSLTYVDVAKPKLGDEITISGVQLHFLAKGYTFDLIQRKLVLEGEK